MSYLRTQFSRLFRAGPQPLRCRSTQVQGLFEHIPAQQVGPEPNRALGVVQVASLSEAEGVPSPCEFEPNKLALKIDEVVPADVGIIEGVVSKIMALIQQAARWDHLEGIELALREALANAVIHGNRSSSAKTVRICVAVQEGRGILLVVKDSGSGFDPTTLPDPLAQQNLLASHGRGIFLIKQFMDDVWFEFENGTAVYMLKRGTT